MLPFLLLCFKPFMRIPNLEESTFKVIYNESFESLKRLC